MVEPPLLFLEGPGQVLPPSIPRGGVRSVGGGPLRMHAWMLDRRSRYKKDTKGYKKVPDEVSFLSNFASCSKPWSKNYRPDGGKVISLRSSFLSEKKLEEA